MEYDFHGHRVTVTPAAEHSHQDEDVFRQANWNIQAGDVVLDIGANVGSYSIPAAVLGAEVHAFDPKMEDCLTIRQIAADNGVTVSAYPIAMWDSEGEQGFSRGGDWSLVHGEFTETVPTTTVDEFCKLLSKVDWIKIDTEGAELHILAGAKETIRKYRPAVIVECHKFIDAEMPAKVEDFFTGLGYRCVHNHDRPFASLEVFRAA